MWRGVRLQGRCLRLFTALLPLLLLPALTVAADDRVIGNCRIVPAALCAQARLTGADLHRSVLDGADLRRANLGAADLNRASLREPDLRGAVLQNANLTGADLSGARIEPSTDFRSARMQGGSGCPAPR